MGAILGGIVSTIVGEVVKAKLSGKPVPADPGKGLWQSRTIYGALVMLAPLVARLFGYDLNEVTASQLAEPIVEIIGLLGVMYGRAKAVKRIG